MVVPPVDHDCALKDVVVQLQNNLAKLQHELALLKKAHVGPKSERAKVPRQPKGKRTDEEKLAARRDRAKQKAAIESVQHEHKVPDAERKCPACGNEKLNALGKGKVTTVWEFVPARFIKHEHVQEVLRCRCNGYVVRAPGLPKVMWRGRYGASFLAHLVVAKCADHLPLYRLEKDFARQGIPMARSTMNDLLHRVAKATAPLSDLLLRRICQREVVHADETRMRMQDGGEGKPKNGFVWTMVGRDTDGALDVALTFAADRSGDTPRRLLEGTKGYLLVDGYSGYNDVANVSSRIRAGCHAHLRRYFHDALATAPVAQDAITLIGELYAVERDIERRGLQDDKKLAWRIKKSKPVRDRLREWLQLERERQLPKSPIGTAIRYALNSWEHLGRFLENPRLPLDNNLAEAALRRIALGRKNYLFVGDAKSGGNVAGLYTLIATCEARQINPFAYLSDVIVKLAEIDSEDVDAVAPLLPASWLKARQA
jgi:transposase